MPEEKENSQPTSHPNEPAAPEETPAAMGRREWMKWLVAATATETLFATPYSLASNQLETTYHHIDPFDGKDSPSSLRIAVITDLHLWGKLSDYDHLIREVEVASPDLIVIVGDTLEKTSRLPLVDILGEMDAPLGKLATLGNWERRRVNLNALKKAYDRLGVELLVNDRHDVGGVQLLGVDDWRTGCIDLEVTVETIRRGPTIVLSHCPIFFDEVLNEIPEVKEARDSRRLLMLSGHTHGGQIAPLGVVPITPRGSGRFVSGWYHEEQGSLFVSRGIGYSGIPLRIGPSPELAILDFD
ncbi:MAG: metallophosphoesterase [Planctomycetota bacterium]